jgi:ribosomal RNA-processing protein 12
VLSSIEETLREQNTKFTPTAYFAALLALLQQSASTPDVENIAELAVSTIYLLDIVSPHVPAALLRTQFNQIFSILSPLISDTEAGAPLVRSSIGCFASLLLAQDAAAWALPQIQAGPRKAILGLLALAADARPKIRKRSQEALTEILQHRPQLPASDHPVSDLCAVFALSAVTAAVEGNNQRGKHKNRADTDNTADVIHTLQLTKTVATAARGWPSKKIEPICEVLLSISRSSNEFLVMSAFEVFEVILQGLAEEFATSKLPRLLDAIVDLKPARNDSQLIPPWIAVLSRGYEVFAHVNPEDAFVKVPELFDLVAPFLTSPSHNIRVSASECLVSFFSTCISTNVILEPSIYDEKVLLQLGEKANGLLAVRYQTAWMEVFTALAALFDALKWRGNPGLLSIVKAVGELRGSGSFQGKKEADELLGHAIRSLGPEVVLSVLPLNLNKPRAGQQGRVWLLPLLRDHVSNTNLTHFKSEFVPLTEHLYQRVLEGPTQKTMEIKIFETVIQHGYCDLPLDLQVSLDQPFAELIANLLYRQTELRGDLCRGLQNLVESNQAILASDLDERTLFLQRRTRKHEAETNLVHLAKFASNLLMVLFNVYSETVPQHRAHILQCINSYLSITPKNEIVETFARVSAKLESFLPKASEPAPPRPTASENKLPPASHALLDLVIAISTHLPRTSFQSLFSLASNILTNPAIVSSDPQLVKKAHKLIPRLSTSTAGVEALEARSSELQSLMLSTADKTPLPARRDRLLALDTLITFLPTNDLHFIPSILSEVVLACKEANERARQAGFGLLVHLANRIADPERNPPGTVIRNSKVAHMPNDAPDALATLEEVFTMVSAGLAGVAPHMVAASITALSRLLFEFHNRLSKSVIEDLVTTVVMFLQSNNREIVRSVLGFVKVAVVVLPESLMKSRMPELVSGMMVWSKENKGRMRVKIKGIFERCIRKFGAAQLEGWVGEDDRKMIVNIRKRKERSKRKKKGGADEEESEDDTGTKNYDNELDEVLGSDEDSQSSDDERLDHRAGASKSRSKVQFIRDNDDDEPLDLLGPDALTNVSTTKAVRFTDRDIGQKKRKVRISEDGKLVFGNGDDADEGDALMAGNGEGAVNAYVDAIDGPDSVRKGQRGRLKVSSGNQKKARVVDQGQKMDLDVDEAREVARKIMQGRDGSHARPFGRGGQSKLPQRRGLGVEKSRNQERSGGGRGRIQKRGNVVASRRDQFRGGRGIRR